MNMFPYLFIFLPNPTLTNFLWVKQEDCLLETWISREKNQDVYVKCIKWCLSLENSRMSRKDQKGHIQKGRRKQWKFSGDVSQPNQVFPPTLFKNAIDISVNIFLHPIWNLTSLVFHNKSYLVCAELSNLWILAYMATSGGHFSRPLGMGSFWS